jgi:hypothetical protein
MKTLKFAAAAAMIAISSFSTAFAAEREGSKSPYVCMTDEGYGRQRPCDAP